MEELSGIVVKGYGLYYTVKYNDKYINCVLRGKLRQSENMKEFTDPVAVGDKVILSLSGNSSGTIDSILERKNSFSRKEKGVNRKSDVIASNIDQLIIIQSFKRPALNLRFTDRLIVRAEKEKIPQVLCVNKSDLADSESMKYIKDYYNNTHVKICIISTLKDEGISELQGLLYNKISLFTGNSGVGKSSIINKLKPGLNLRTSGVSESTNKGRHTTANIEMIEVSENITVIDTPGLREFSVSEIDRVMLGNYFTEFVQYKDKCSFNTCTHDHEPGCRIKKMVEERQIFRDRYESYVNILHSL